jgi:hypothetical protein
MNVSGGESTGTSGRVAGVIQTDNIADLAVTAFANCPTTKRR